MKNKSKKKKKIILIIIILICIFLLCILFQKKLDFRDDLIFFKIFGKSQEKISNLNSNSNLNVIDIFQNNLIEEYSNNKQYVFNVRYNNTDFKEINLLETIDTKTLVNEKIAPGTSGAFDIVLNSNIDTQYQINFKSKNIKPENLKFKIQGKEEEFNNLEELEKNLIGNIKTDETIKITINWNWKYENNKLSNMQDTEDGKNIRKYNFDIYVIGEQNLKGEM